MDALYVIGKSSQYNNLELRLSLRSLEQNAHGLESVFIVGEKPDWIKNIVYTPIDDVYTRENNVFRKILTACKLDISKNFLFMNDDFYMMSPFNMDEYPYFVNGEVVGIKNPSRYQEVQNKTLCELNSKGINRVMDYRVHCPIILNKEKFLSLYSYYKKSKFDRVGYSPRLLYGNLFVENYIIAEDCKLWGLDEIKETKQKCISTKDDCADVLKELLKKFNVPSKYEKDDFVLKS